MDRRDWLTRVARSGAASGATLGLCVARATDASAEDGDFEATLARLGVGDAQQDGRLVVEVPDEAWTGASVDIRIDGTAFEEVRELHVLRDDHAPALLVSLTRTGASPLRVALPARLDRPCRVHAFARTPDGWTTGSGRVRTVGSPGCG